VLIITRFPTCGKRFFRRIRKILGPGHSSHFWRLAFAIAAVTGRRSLKRMRGHFKRWRTPEAISHFLEQSDWDAPELLKLKALDTLSGLGYKPGQVVHFILDDTQKLKRGKVMAAVARLFAHAQKVYGNGHTILVACLVYRGVIIPYAVRLWANQEFCQQSQHARLDKDRILFEKLTAMAARMVRELKLPDAGKPVVLFDSYYLCSKVMLACDECGYKFIGMSKKNRNFTPNGRPWDQRNIGVYGHKVLERKGKWLKIGKKSHLTAERIGRLSKAGKRKVVFSRREGETKEVALVTNALDWGAKQILETYRDRWPIEILFKMSKQHLGFGDYQILGYTGVVRYLHLVMIAYLLLTHLALDQPDAQAQIKDKEKTLRLPSIPLLQELLRRQLFHDSMASFARTPEHRAFANIIHANMVF
jgi:SRSO17 transposase